MKIKPMLVALGLACVASAARSQDLALTPTAVPSKAAAPQSRAAQHGIAASLAGKKTYAPATVHKASTRKPGHVPTISPPRSHAHVKVAVRPTKPVAKPAPKPPALPRPVVPPDIGTVTKMPLPRFASLKSDDVNMRAGPGTKYPVNWVYKRRELPVKIEREFDIWRLVEDMDGVRGWVNQGTLVGKRGFVITGTENRTIRAEAREDAAAIAILKPGVVGRLRACAAATDWCEVQVQDYRGWLKRDDFWGSLPSEVVQP